MTNLISATLRDRAEGDIHIERLLSAVHTGARRRRQRRLTMSACAVVAVAALAAAGSVATSGTRDAPASPAPGADIPRPAVVEGSAVASFTPTVLGSDPTLFHLDVTGLDGWGAVQWSSRTAYEEISGMATETGGQFSIEASQTRQQLPGLAGEITPTEVKGLPAEAVRATPAVDGSVTYPPRGNHAVRWEAVPGIWVQVVVMAGPEAAMRIAERVRLDRTFRCALPFRLTGLGDQVRMIKCDVWFTGVYRLGGAYLTNAPTDGDYREYYVGVGRPERDPVPNETIGGRAVRVEPGDATPPGTRPGARDLTNASIEYPYESRVAYFYPFFTTVDDPFLRSLVPAFEPVTDPDPRAWPQSPLR
jgi:hypothetical protein